jgi:hypothetical protein
MKKIFTALLISALLSCSKEKEVFLPITINPTVPVITQPPVFNSSFNAVINSEAMGINSILNTRGAGNMDISGMTNNARVDIRVRRITQTGNSTGIVLIGFYDVVYAEKNKEGGWVEYFSKDERLGIYNNMPLTDSIVSGYFAATVSTDSSFTNAKQLKGDFRVRY